MRLAIKTAEFITVAPVYVDLVRDQGQLAAPSACGSSDVRPPAMFARKSQK